MSYGDHLYTCKLDFLLWNEEFSHTQSFSTDTRFMIEASFSTHAKTVKAASNPTLQASEDSIPRASTKKMAQEAATAARWRTKHSSVSLWPVSTSHPHHTYQLTSAQLSIDSPYQCTARPRMIAESPMRREPQHTRTWAAGSRERW